MAAEVPVRGASLRGGVWRLGQPTLAVLATLGGELPIHCLGAWDELFSREQ